MMRRLVLTQMGNNNDPPKPGASPPTPQEPPTRQTAAGSRGYGTESPPRQSITSPPSDDLYSAFSSSNITSGSSSSGWALARSGAGLGSASSLSGNAAARLDDEYAELTTVGLEELVRRRTLELNEEKKKTELLLNRMLPKPVADSLLRGQAVVPEKFSDVTIYFSDIIGFTTIAAHSEPIQIVNLLNELYTGFDEIIFSMGVYKVETIGDSYMCASGLPTRIPDHAEQIATMALQVLHFCGKFKIPHMPSVPLLLRIGIHTGEAIAGVVGQTMPRYCLFGDAVNVASRMESTGAAQRVHLSEATHRKLTENAPGSFLTEFRGEVELRGKGRYTTYWLLGKRDFGLKLPTAPPIDVNNHGLAAEYILRMIRETGLDRDQPPA